ncbi:MAG TPA: 16S rRNA (cytosine(967)-C(5))-methyltransferase [Chlorobaculum sp.]|uniref:16S rRNA (cytosine(967)-C(5))-methyltransferase n=1 Tax=Chlorobaculum tepidum (strain ATCC 49652 / DSM 12025 / NBRC 103806 / TLS) TaxID=194439 RepID=Q8KES9_CHLTE|nr:16S rRNA (cytosine(967)-C(5))-methyltransferase RsmB [Chlorobaculum tepidum]AAM71845.1 sun protein [Chlorobaculum tepidum TLS]HBU24084.1 16S rRNA (cytosine(967)-C(5))-methyltransferase [Chlorobaculum sp.]
MTARELALRVLLELDGMRKSEELLNRMHEHAGLGKNDRALAKELVAGTLKYRLQCDFIIARFYRHDYAKAATVLKHILRLGVYQLLRLDRVPKSAAVNESVKLARKFKGDHLARLVNGLLRNISKATIDLDAWTAEMPESKRLSILYSFPEWLAARWLMRYGPDATLAMLAHGNLPPATGYRINRLKANPETLLARPELSDAKRVADADGLDRFFFSKQFALLEPLLKEGLVSVQNPAQGQACLMAAPEPGSTVFDMCAAPGGKSTFMAELMENRGRIIALDRTPAKVARIASNASALGITIIEPREGDALTFDPGCAMDTILLDAPCTGTGVLGRRAELRWRTTPEKLRELAALQAAMLDRAASLLRPGGVLLYATCSVEPEENELQTEAFLKRHPEFIAEASRLTLPGSHEGFDGGFAARFRKTEG